MIRSIAAIALLALAGCDSGTPWKHGNYALVWIDLPDEVTLSYCRSATSSIPLVDARVFSVGANDRYVVAKQHPKGDKAITNYFVIDKAKVDPINPRGAATIGPMTEVEFQKKVEELSLPAFSKTLERLR